MKIQKEVIKKNIPRVCLIIFILIFVGTSYTFINWYTDNLKTKKLVDKIIEKTDITEEPVPIEATPVNTTPSTVVPVPKVTLPPSDYINFMKMSYISVNFDNLLKQNKDTVGWIHMESTNINYPVVQTTNNDYYINRAFNKTTNSAGWIFMDYRNNAVDFTKNTILYGHARLDKTLFGTLKNVLTTTWFNNQNNHIIKLSTPTKNTIWQIFSVYVIPVESYYLTTNFYNNDKYFQVFIDTITNRSQFNFNAKPIVTDKILTLSTCQVGNNKNRIVVHAKLISEQKR